MLSLSHWQDLAAHGRRGPDRHKRPSFHSFPRSRSKRSFISSCWRLLQLCRPTHSWRRTASLGCMGCLTCCGRTQTPLYYRGHTPRHRDERLSIREQIHASRASRVHPRCLARSSSPQLFDLAKVRVNHNNLAHHTSHEHAARALAYQWPFVVEP
jgi:hypothetical protein